MLKLLECIPNAEEIDQYIKFANEYNAGFEYNEFYSPKVLDSRERIQELIHIYRGIDRDRSHDTLHGAFLDITVHSVDPCIQAVANYRIHQSMDIAMELGVRAVVFHTNRIPYLRTKDYEDNWLKSNEIFWRKILEEYKEIRIYIENMFDENPCLVTKLAKNMAEEEKFGLCYDIAHAKISNTSLMIWNEAMAPYIRHIHLNDNNGVVDSHDAVGDCNIVWREYSELIKKMNYQPSVLIEVHGIEKLLRSVEFMKKNKLYPF